MWSENYSNENYSTTGLLFYRDTSGFQIPTVVVYEVALSGKEPKIIETNFNVIKQIYPAFFYILLNVHLSFQLSIEIVNWDGN